MIANSGQRDAQNKVVSQSKSTAWLWLISLLLLFFTGLSFSSRGWITKGIFRDSLASELIMSIGNKQSNFTGAINLNNNTIDQNNYPSEPQNEYGEIPESRESNSDENTTGALNSDENTTQLPDEAVQDENGNDDPDLTKEQKTVREEKPIQKEHKIFEYDPPSMAGILSKNAGARTKDRAVLTKWDMESSFGPWGSQISNTGGFVTMLSRASGPSNDNVNTYTSNYVPHICSRKLACDRDPSCKAFIVSKSCVNGDDYPKTWRTVYNFRPPIQNELYYMKWRATHTLMQDLPEDDWIFFSDLDALVTNSDIKLSTFTALAGEKSVMVVDRKQGLPNAGCFFVKNNDIGRRFVRYVLSLTHLPLFQEDNGAMAMAIAHLLKFERVIPTRMSMLKEFYEKKLRWAGLKFSKRGLQNHPHVYFFNHGELPGPFCVRPNMNPFHRATEPVMHINSGDPRDKVPTSFMLHYKKMIKPFDEVNYASNPVCADFSSAFFDRAGQFC